MTATPPTTTLPTALTTLRAMYTYLFFLFLSFTTERRAQPVIMAIDNIRAGSFSFSRAFPEFFCEAFWREERITRARPRPHDYGFHDFWTFFFFLSGQGYGGLDRWMDGRKDGRPDG